MLELDVTPRVPAALRAALRAALERGGVVFDEPSAAYTSAWRRTAAREAVDNEPGAPRGWNGRYTLSPRSTRGATRA